MHVSIRDMSVYTRTTVNLLEDDCFKCMYVILNIMYVGLQEYKHKFQFLTSILNVM